MAGVERSGVNSKRHRIGIDMTLPEIEELQEEARERGLFDGRHGVGIYARKILLERHEKSAGGRLNEALDLLSQAGINIILRDHSGKQILEMPADTFRTFMESDPALINHFINQNPAKPQ